MILLLLFAIFTTDSFAQSGGGACPRLERQRMGDCGVAESQICHSGSACLCVRCGASSTMQITEFRPGPVIGTEERCVSRGPEQPPVCVTIEIRAPATCSVVTIECSLDVELGPPQEPSLCDQPCPACPAPFNMTCKPPCRANMVCPSGS